MLSLSLGDKIENEETRMRKKFKNNMERIAELKSN